MGRYLRTLNWNALLQPKMVSCSALTLVLCRYLNWASLSSHDVFMRLNQHEYMNLWGCGTKCMRLRTTFSRGPAVMKIRSPALAWAIWSSCCLAVSESSRLRGDFSEPSALTGATLTSCTRHGANTAMIIHFLHRPIFNFHWQHRAQTLEQSSVSRTLRAGFPDTNEAKTWTKMDSNGESPLTVPFSSSQKH